MIKLPIAIWQNCIKCGQEVFTVSSKDKALCDSCSGAAKKDICPYCNKPIEGQGEWDHIIPKSKGGSSKKSNLVYACRKCNQEKAGRTPLEWLGKDIEIVSGVRTR